MRHQIPYISFLDFESFVVFLFDPYLVKRFVSAYVGVFQHCLPQTLVQTAEDRCRFRQKSAYCSAPNSEVIVCKPRSYAVHRHRVHVVHLGTERDKASVEVGVLQGSDRSFAADYGSVLAVEGDPMYFLFK